MPFSQVQIVNKALIKLGSGRIVAITDDTKQARTMAAIWDMQRDIELAAHPWEFAMKRADLPALGDAPTASPYGKAFQLPTDCLKVVELGSFWSMYYPSEGGEFFQRIGSTIECDESSPLRIRYIRRVTNPGEFGELFAEALACRLAAEASLDETEASTKRKSAWDEYAVAVSVARRSNAIEKPPQRPVPDSWELAMRGMAG
jgi:hypothetical protein